MSLEHRVQRNPVLLLSVGLAALFLLGFLLLVAFGARSYRDVVDSQYGNMDARALGAYPAASVKAQFGDAPYQMVTGTADVTLATMKVKSYTRMRATPSKKGKKLIKNVSLFDVYRGDKIPAGKKQYAMNFVLQDPERTLTDTDVEGVMGRVLASFENAFGAKLR